ncbi:IclR family transcriptional regulator [Hyphococcus sp.]|jgi:DNA-binding IclR family transcriptional regulator|uniref:IclR family transcriptional regulator n=1 Tax=Hyphococcus sp. TaxID=2038636 RepID=UPI003D098ADA
MVEDREGGSGVKSVSQAIRILNVVAQMDGPVSLKEIAARAGVAPSKAHRYLQSLCTCGFLSQATKSGAYDLGMETLRLGLAAINRVDIINRAGEALSSLTSETESDSFLTVWADNGPTMVRFERSKKPAMAMMGAGVSMPVLNSATGLVFLAFGNPDRVAEVVRRQENENYDAVMKQIAARIETVREAGYASSIGVIMTGRQCISAPIISYDDKVIAAVSLVSTKPDIVEPDSKEVKALLDFCKLYSIRKRGYSEETLIEKRIAI